MRIAIADDQKDVREYIAAALSQSEPDAQYQSGDLPRFWPAELQGDGGGAFPGVIVVKV